MSTCKSIKKVIQEIDYWLRLSTAQHGLLKHQLLCVLHNKNNGNYQGLPEDPLQLYYELSTTHKPTINALVKKRVLKQDQLKLLLPSDGSQKTDSQAFDVTLIVLLIINCTTLPPPVNGWYKPPLDSDASVAASVLRARAWRNFLNHANANSIDQAKFNEKWKEAIDILQGLGGSVKEMATLRTISLDPKHMPVMESLMNFYERKLETVKIDVNQQLDKQNQQMVATNNETEHQINLIMSQLQHISNENKQLKKLTEESLSKDICSGKIPNFRLKIILCRKYF